MKPVALVSNDDGIQSIGINALNRALSEVFDVWVVAPDRERSAVSNSISLHVPIRAVERVPQSFQVDGTPADCVYLALHHLLPVRPDIVVSGINHGPNLGTDVLYSGTVAAATEGAMVGLPSLAISLCLPEDKDFLLTEDHFEPAGVLARRLAQNVVKNHIPKGVLLNVNVPFGVDDPPTRVCRLGQNNWKHSVVTRLDPRNRPYYWIGGTRLDLDENPESDIRAIVDEHASVTPIHPDLTAHHLLSMTEELTTSS